MANLKEIQLDLPQGAIAPKAWDFSHGPRLNLDAVVSTGEYGEPLSYVGDFVWNWKFYTPRKTSSPLPFTYWKETTRQIIHEEEITEQRLTLIRELQYLMVLRVYCSDTMQGYGSLRCHLSNLWFFARFAEAKRCAVRDVLEQRNLLEAFIVGVPASQAAYVMRWLTFLGSLDPVLELGFEVARPKNWKVLFTRAKQYREGRKQHAPLPTRIYLGLINALSSELDDIEAHRDSLLAAMREGIVMHAQHMAKYTQLSASFGPELIAKHGLGKYLQRKGFALTARGLSGAVIDVLRTCKTQIHVFSGMRHEEAEHLPYYCMETVNAGHGRTHSLIEGVTTKLVGARRKRTRWVTTDAQGFRAIRLAQFFADVIYEYLGVKPNSADATKDNFPLFVSPDYLPWGVALDVPSVARYAPSTALNIRSMSAYLKTALCLVIEVEDIVELEAVDPFRDWAGEPEYAVGQPWPLKSHQLRRSLALYANASGLVRTSSLRRQLQHITREMAEYYGRGSVFAKNFLADDPKEYAKHVCVEWQDAEQEAQYLAFTRDVLNSDEPLYGVGGRFFDLQKQRGEVMAPEEVKQQLKMGRLAYKAHPLGGCTQVGTCDKQKGLRLSSGICVSEHCKSLVGKHSSILKIISIQRVMLSRVDPDSIAYQIEKEELDILEAAEVQWRSANRPLTAFGEGSNV